MPVDSNTRSDSVGWRPIASHPTYEVSRGGDVRKIGGPSMGQFFNQHGYKLVRLSSPRATMRVHRLVAFAFIPNPEEKPFVNHINNDRADNRADNLEWCTQKENIAHADRQGRMVRDYWVGRRSPNAALTDEQVMEIRSAYTGGGRSHQSLALEFGISKRAIGRLLNGETYV